MKIKGILITIILCFIIVALFIIDKVYDSIYPEAPSAFLVYLNGEKIGMINSDADLYNLINQEQEEIVLVIFVYYNQHQKGCY